MNYSDDSMYRFPITAGERVCSEAGALCKALLSLKTLCAEHSRPELSDLVRSHSRKYYNNKESD